MDDKNQVIRGKAPLRISFGGGGTDVAPFCDDRGGAIIGSTINKYAYCSIIPKNTDEITVHSLDFDMTVKYNAKDTHQYDGNLDLVKAALNAFSINKGCDVYLQCDAPAGSGLGTSSTVMVALLSAMAKWKGVSLDFYELADLAYQVEREELGISGGYQDQYAATFGGFNFIEFHGRNNVVVNPLRIKKDVINELQYNLLLCYTGKIHVSANVIKDQVSNYTNNNVDAITAMSEVKALAYGMKDELLKGNLHSFGKLLDYGWQSKKRMSNKISNPQIDELYDEALKAGALGGKLLGAGGGGYLLMYCPYNVKHKVAERMEQVGGQLSDWNFELRGVQTWSHNNDRWPYNQIQVDIPDGNYKFNF
ncbi:D-glycero-alpha-D-manno-heptose-7-phosphate kinase [Lachnotalea glycerini]|uniref:D-glycero-alpha-D-manno-heptose-7-phosphate kinase n=1 Tax=Lachnotalea glycerini TaxID=1763509 RepID=A0A318EMZ2_9FIRM|nr:GHMP kinase [Lachnotalea glycerini]PXV91455.1 D-glycero-alpha-D-manno-heptose-7-phosphate kinase [Lachnotalea glycerini]RDY31726.1 GHMP kinase [Lachnotalea glycerini]